MKSGLAWGHLNYNVLLKSLHSLGRDIPIMLEHLEGEEEYRLAASYVRTVAARMGGNSIEL
jgi:hypothetical protein